MRGQQRLFNDMLEREAGGLPRSGRSEHLHKLRNECLVHRYYFYFKFTDKRYEAILEILKSEFFIETFTIQDRLNEGYDVLASLRTEAPGKAYFAKKWPHLVWP